MSAAEIERLVLDFPAEVRLDLARRLVESVISPASLESDVKEGMRRIEDVLTGKVTGLSQEQFRAALG